jgi:hypothetical protein
MAARIRFAVIGMNHGHINSQVGAMTRGGGEFVSYYAKECSAPVFPSTVLRWVSGS